MSGTNKFNNCGMSYFDSSFIMGFRNIANMALSAQEYILGFTIKSKRKNNIIKDLDEIIGYATEMRNELNKEVEDYKEV